jgi:hypothetical protein
MSFFGFPPSVLLGVGGAAFAATIGLYILKLRRRPVAVPFSPIWQRVLKDKDASQLYSRLKNLLSLLLQLALLTLLVLALGDPRPTALAKKGETTVVLVDTSASMQASDVLPSRLAQAKAKVHELVGGLGGSDRMLVAKMDASTVPVTTMTGEATELNEGVDRLVATDTRVDLRRALAFSADVLHGVENPQIVVVSDGALDTDGAGKDLGNVPVRFIPIGKRGRNVAITGFSVRRYPLDASRYEVMLEVTNTDAAPENIELTLLGDGNVVDVSRLSLKPKERLPRFYTDLGGASQKLEARIRLADGTKDDLGADDRAYALMPERRRARVQVVTRGNTYLDAALLLDEYLDVTTVAPAAYNSGGAFDLTIFDGVAPQAPEHGGALYLNPPESGSPVKLGRALSDFGFDSWDKHSPLLRFMAVDNVQIAHGHALVPDKDDHVVGASEQGPIVVSGRRDGHPYVVTGFDPRDSDLVLRVAWPLFVLNVIHSFVEEDATYLSSFRTGEVWQIPAPSDDATVWIKDPAGVRHEVAVKEGRATFFGEHAGFYELEGAGKAVATLFAANLVDPDESQIEPVKDLRIGGERATAVAGFHIGIRRDVWVYLVAAVLLLSVFEWLGYHRRITV